MIAKANDGGYGMFSEPALEFTTILNQLELRVNAQNLNAISNSLYYLFWAMEDLKSINQDITDGKTAFDSANYPLAFTHFSSANTSLDDAIPKMNQSYYYMNQTEEGGMVQVELDGTRAAIETIYLSLVAIQADVIFITSVAETGAPTPQDLLDVDAAVTNIFATLLDVNTQLLDITVQPT
jgi:hypothetical protein